MKQIIKRVLLSVCVSIGIIVGLCGCANESTRKKFEKAGLSITLTTDFYEKEHVEYTAYYASSKMIVLTIKESFDTFEMVGQDAETMAVEDYAGLVIDTYKDFYNSASDVSTENDMVSFVYENDALGKDYKYIWFGFKAVDAFWAVQFGCVESDFDNLQSEMLAYAKTVEVEKFVEKDSEGGSSGDPSDTETELLAFQKNDDEQGYTVTGLGTVSDSHIVIPSEHEGLPVTAIGKSAFAEKTQIKSVVIPDSITSIGQSAFKNCEQLESVALPKGITCIEMGTFNGCKSLRSIIIPDSVEQIGHSAFYGCHSLNRVTLGENVKTIDMLAFFGCYTLVEIQNDSELLLQVGGTNNFEGLTSRARYIYSENEQSNLFVDDNGYIIFSEGEKKVLVGYQGENKNLVVPSSITELQAGVFFERDFINVALPNSLEVIGESAFSHCYDLTDVNVPIGVKDIPNDAFYRCGALKEIVLPSTIEGIGAEAFYGCKSLRKMKFPDSVISIGSLAFSECDSLESVTLPNSVTGMGWAVFSGCDSLTTVSWSVTDNKTATFFENIFQNCPNLQYNTYDNADYLGDAENPYQILIKAKTQDIRTCKIFESAKIIYCGAFWNCSRLVEVEIPDSVFDIGKSTFRECVNLTKITLGSSLSNIGQSAFYGCGKLIEVYNKSLLEIEQGQQTFGGVAQYAKIVYSQDGDGKIHKENGHYIYNDGDKKTLVAYSGNETNVTIPEGVQELGESAFFGNQEMESVQIPNSVTTIGGGAFMECESLQTVDIPDSVTEIGAAAFGVCTSLKTVRLPNGIMEITEELFAWCENLTNIIIPDSVTKIGNYAFQGCAALSWIVWGENISSVGMSVFYNCQTIYYKGSNFYTQFVFNNVYYYSELEPALNDSGNAYAGDYWRYVDGVPTVWVYSEEE